MEYSLKMELIAMLLIAILALFHHDKKTGPDLRYQLFSICLGASELTILVDVASTITITFSGWVPLSFNIALVTVYFIILYFTFSIMAVYSFYIMFEHAASKHCMHRALNIVVLLGVILLAVSVCNLWTGWLFSFQDGRYIRGPLNHIGYAALTVELCMFVFCYIRNRKTVSLSVRRVVYILPPLVVLLTIFQSSAPNILLNGTLAALANMILFISFQSSRIGQDPLTGLQNRSSFFRDLSILRKKHGRCHIILVYLERYGSVNQKLGVNHGDTLMYMTARYLEHFSPAYQAYRFGNTQFILLGICNDEMAARQNAVLVRERFLAPWKSDEHDCILDASLADIICSGEEREDAQIIGQLEYALKCAKAGGGGRLVHFDERLNLELQRQNHLLDLIRNALAEESFQIYYQPIYLCGSGRFCSAESLLRLTDKNGEPVSPSEFVPLAEENGLIDSISWLVLKKVCLFLGEHPELPLDSVSINMSMQQLADKRLDERVLSCLKEYGVPPEKIKIEITERVIAEDLELARSAMTRLIRKKVNFSLDDFGIGYSNFASMLSLPFETVKLDASLIGGIETDGGKFDTIKLLIQMLHRSGHIVVAEGVETEAQMLKASELGIDRIQGYYYAKPMPEREFQEFLDGMR